MNRNFQYDLVILGSGPGGYVAAIRAAQLGMKTAVVEKENLGGICLNWGCIPTKALLKSAEVIKTIQNAHQYGVQTQGFSFDFPAIIKRSRQIASRLSKGVGFLLKKNEVEVYEGLGSFIDQHTLEITRDNGETEQITATSFLLATGARPRNLPGLELDGEKLVSYRQAMTLPALPESMIIIGAGAIGVEFAYFYNTLGTKVTLIEMMPQILPLEDAEIAEVLHKSFKKAKIEVAVDTSVSGVEKQGDQVTVFATGNQGDVSWSADLCLLAVGVQANSDGIGLENIGVDTDRGFVKVDKSYRTSCPNVWAIGDLIGAPMLAHAASHEGILAVENMAGHAPEPLNPNQVPSCTFCHPQVASVGLTEEHARTQYPDIRVGRFPFVASSRAVAAGERDGLVKVIYDTEGKTLLGAHIIGPEATELIAELGLAQHHPDPVKAISGMIHAHPTLAETLHEATLDAFGRAIHI